MEDQTSWKGHTFTLIVFTGIVVLCSIFFILGMLVGRTQGQKLALAASVSAAARADSRPVPREDSKPDLTFFDSVQKTEPSSLEPPPPKLEPVVPEPPAVPSNVLNYQIGALRKSVRRRLDIH